MQDTLQVIAEPRRREILRLVWDEELAAGEIAARFDVTWPAVSQHLRVLRDHGLVMHRREGTRRLYRADRDALAPFAEMLRRMWERDLDRLAELAEDEEVRG